MSFTPTYNVMKVVDRVSPPCRERVGGASRGQPTRGNRALRSDPATAGGSDAGQRSEDPVTPSPIHNGTHTSPTGITQRHLPTSAPEIIGHPCCSFATCRPTSVHVPQVPQPSATPCPATALTGLPWKPSLANRPRSSARYSSPVRPNNKRYATARQLRHCERQPKR